MFTFVRLLFAWEQTNEKELEKIDFENFNYELSILRKKETVSNV
jgi:hypothetical protein